MSEIAHLYLFRMSNWRPYRQLSFAVSLTASDNSFQSGVIIQTSCKKNINDYRFVNFILQFVSVHIVARNKKIKIKIRL